MENKQRICKERGNNFSREELNKLRELLEKYSIILNKKTDHVSSKQKEEAWCKLTNEFNCDNSIYRSKKQLVNKFNNLKKCARQELSQEKNERRCTGGGPPPPKVSDTTEWICSIMSESIVGLPSTCDSDFTQDNTENEEILQNLVPDVEEGIPIIHIPLIEDQFHEDITSSATGTHESIIDEKQEKEVFDASTPKSMLKQPVSKPLVLENRKRKLICTPLETRKNIVTMANEKQQYVKKKGIREQKLLEFAEEEHYKNMQHKDELHKMEIEFRRKLNEVILRKSLVEVEIEEEKLKKIKFENKDLLDK